MFITGLYERSAVMQSAQVRAVDLTRDLLLSLTVPVFNGHGGVQSVVDFLIDLDTCCITAGCAEAYFLTAILPVTLQESTLDEEFPRSTSPSSLLGISRTE